jgi:hypothetical protein
MGVEVSDALLSSLVSTLQMHQASFDKLRMSKIFMARRKVPHPELVEGRTVDPALG